MHVQLSATSKLKHQEVAYIAALGRETVASAVTSDTMIGM
jgi:hypothetical protein